jgi:RimJ/RimL family protein N-acetyltransferase
MSSAERRLETERLVLREWRDLDLDALAAMNADPEVMRFIGDARVLDRAESAAQLERIRGHWDAHGFGRWAVERKDSGEVIGFCGLGFPRFFPEVAMTPEIGWRFARAQWGKGYATEAGIASRDSFFRSFGFGSIISLVLPGNVASIRVMEKLGLRADGQIPGSGGRVVLVHRLDRVDWKAAA